MGDVFDLDLTARDWVDSTLAAPSRARLGEIPSRGQPPVTLPDQVG